jgi:dienelactone hydrolase
MRLAAILCIVVASLFARPAMADEFVREDLRIAMPAAGPNGLEALLIRPARPGRYPLALISHGASGDAQERQEMTPYGFYRQAIEFARHGFAALVVMRRGYGGSPGSFAEGHSCCEARTLLGSAKESADDLRAAIAAMRSRNDVTTQGMIAVGVSGGGLASIALTVDPLPGLAAVISFAGGLTRAQRQANDARAAGDEAGLVEAFKTLGEGSRIPMLWIYSANDSYFRPEFAHRLLAAFTSGGGQATLIDAPAFGGDGHLLFSSGVAMWPRMVDDFLREQKLGSRDVLPPAAIPPLPAPPRLSDKGRASFTDYLTAGPHKAFAVAPSGAFGYWSGTRSAEAAKSRAIGNCRANAPDCAIYAVDNALVAAEAKNGR